MMIAILVIGYVLFLRYLDKKNRERDRQRMGIGVSSAPPDYASLKRDLEAFSERLTNIEKSYQALGRHLGGVS